MKGFLLDTNVISELRRPRPDPAVVAFVAAQPEESLFLSDVTFAEIRFGIEQATDPERRAALLSWLSRTLQPLFAGRTLALTQDVLLRWRLLLEIGRRRGHTFGQLDLLIAATAAEEQLVVASRDAIHFVAAGVAYLNPWTAEYISDAGRRHTLPDLAAPDLIARLAALDAA